jgi:hypothetical protein
VAWGAGRVCAPGFGRSGDGIFTLDGAGRISFGKLRFRNAVLFAELTTPVCVIVIVPLRTHLRLLSLDATSALGPRGAERHAGGTAVAVMMVFLTNCTELEGHFRPGVARQ